MDRAESDAAAARDGQQAAEEEVRRVKAVAEQAATQAATDAKASLRAAQVEEQGMRAAAELGVIDAAEAKVTTYYSPHTTHHLVLAIDYSRVTTYYLLLTTYH